MTTRSVGRMYAGVSYFTAHGGGRMGGGEGYVFYIENCNKEHRVGSMRAKIDHTDQGQ